MEKFIVSARKYRPQNFSTVVGQSHITTTLKNAIQNNQLAHAFLFCGPRGVGKTTCARILAKTINCENRDKDGEACNKCNSCTTFNDGASLNIHELDAASNNSVDDIRTLVEQVRFAPQAGKYKVYIVDEVHMLSASAFNAFLKTLEEPPSYAIFILATTEKHKILPTILSRCQIFDFKRITPYDTVEHLQEIADKENIKAEKEALHLIAQKSEGCMRDALSILDKIVSFTGGQLNYANTLEHLNILDDDYYFKLLDCLQQQDIAGALLLFDEINRKGFEGDTVLNGFAEFLRNLMICKNEKALSLLEVAETFKDKYAKAGKANSLSYLVSALNIVGEAEMQYRLARNKRLHVEMALIKLNYLSQALELTAGGETILKKKRIEGPVAYKVVGIHKKEHATGAVTEPAPATTAPAPSAKLYVETTPAKIFTVNVSEPEPMATTALTKPINKNIKSSATAKTGGLLSQLKNKLAAANEAAQNAVALQLNDADLRNAWNGFTALLSADSKFSAVTNFKSAQLKINDANSIDIVTGNEIQLKFIEQESTNLLEHLQEAFNNKALKINLLVDASLNEVVADDTTVVNMNSKDRFAAIVDEYPLVKELKDRLKLELDY
jgi:DNA polymerase III subunit gamma/tau